MSVALARLSSQLLVEGRSPVEVVSHFGAMQGQDFPGVITSIALRTQRRSRQDIIDAFNSGALVRTWPQRGTLHVVGSDRVRDVLAVARKRTFPGTVKRREALGIDEQVLEQARTIARDVVGDGITRKELAAAWESAGLVNQPGQVYHLIFHLSIEGLLGWGPMRGKEQLLVLLDRWVAPSAERPYEDTIADIVTRYVTSHAPTTRKDAAWWANIPVTAVDRALEGSRFVLKDGYWRKPDESLASSRSIQVLPGFDEMILGYSDRSASVADEHAVAICPGGNGVFKPTIMSAGRVIGTWQKTGLQTTYFAEPTTALDKRVQKALRKLPLSGGS
ncbi:MAG: winged helix DNA-binding domain-containing protein [Flaviflexus sp.]|uniref:winged helix DNA-binding domain-containing protein n=1 Tax=Flaviflexus sp. TaxID=1969482 RepID=UPI003F8E2EB9